MTHNSKIMTDIYYKSTRVRDFRKANKLSQEDLASFLGVNQGYISQVETKGQEPRELMISLINNDKGWDIAPLVSSPSIQVNTNGDNIGGDKVTNDTKDIRIAKLTAIIEEKDKQIAFLWQKIDEYFKR